MYKKAEPFFLYTETSLHPGSGTELGIVDLPIQREKHTDLPIIQSSALKGCLREAFKGSSKKDEMNIVFGPEDATHAGALTVTDGRLLLFPVRSLKGIFHWITCPAVLERCKKEISLAKSFRAMIEGLDITVPVPAAGSALVANLEGVVDGKAVLEEYTYPVEQSEEVSNISQWLLKNAFPEGEEYNYWQKKLPSSLVVLPDDDFRDFANLSTEVVARTKINGDTKTVEKGGLWYEENIPSDTLFYSLAFASNPLVKNLKNKPIQDGDGVLRFLIDGLPDRIQIGGDQTIGRGIVKTRIKKEVLNGSSGDQN